MLFVSTFLSVNLFRVYLYSIAAEYFSLNKTSAPTPVERPALVFDSSSTLNFVTLKPNM